MVRYSGLGAEHNLVTEEPSGQARVGLLAPYMLHCVRDVSTKRGKDHLGCSE